MFLLHSVSIIEIRIIENKGQGGSAPKIIWVNAEMIKSFV